jgi:oligoribonuclease
VPDAEQMVLAHLRKHIPDARTVPLCGNSIATDRAFLARDMPELDSFLHYRMVDVSSLKELARRWYPRVYFSQPQKGLAHRALADIRESIRELRYYRQTLFVPPPGPSGEEAQKAAAEVLAVDPA